MIRSAFIRRMAMAALSCAFLDVRVPAFNWEPEPASPSIYLRRAVDSYIRERAARGAFAESVDGDTRRLLLGDDGVFRDT